MFQMIVTCVINAKNGTEHVPTDEKLETLKQSMLTAIEKQTDATKSALTNLTVEFLTTKLDNVTPVHGVRTQVRGEMGPIYDVFEYAAGKYFISYHSMAHGNTRAMRTLSASGLTELVNELISALSSTPDYD